MCIEEGGTLTLKADDNTLTKLVAKYCRGYMRMKRVAELSKSNVDKASG